MLDLLRDAMEQPPVFGFGRAGATTEGQLEVTSQGQAYQGVPAPVPGNLPADVDVTTARVGRQLQVLGAGGYLEPRS